RTTIALLPPFLLPKTCRNPYQVPLPSSDHRQTQPTTTTPAAHHFPTLRWITIRETTRPISVQQPPLVVSDSHCISDFFYSFSQEGND
ncbi:hypothetical protein HAX54_036747, partial [Datura stramonium]|nr:hypothetical protein [Datura stramonium]